MTKPTLCLDFDGVLHSYSSGWKGAAVIPDPPVTGALQFILDAMEHFKVSIYSSRSGQEGGIVAMQQWLADWFREWASEDSGRWPSKAWREETLDQIEWPTSKPAAFLTIDDRALTFDGTWPKASDLLTFQPWNKRPIGATGRFPQGVLNDDDQGELKIAVAFDKADGLVHLDFGKPVAWTAFQPEMAVQLARMLLKHAGARKVEIML
jgi:hypothetical protein